ncbi:hypothetical protein ACFOVU_19165 [Nocardiopsis sediminis]|uniref:Sensor domain-containing protein n=1 Tax=Nocardiopsis sediminis TaxID=1778267 RepID=A0ABV8FTJ5_9ACTN
MEYALRPRTAAASALAGAWLLIGATACGPAGGGGDTDTGQDAGTVAASALSTAQLVQFGEAKVVPERSEQGVYGELATVRQTDRLREVTELDKPGCLDAVNQWGRLPEVRDAAASLATFARGDDTVSHLLIDAPAGTAQEAVDTAPPAECDSYTATMQDGSTSSYRVSGIDLEQIGDASRAFAVDTEVGGESVSMYTMVYRNGDVLGTTSVLGPSRADHDFETLLTGFTTAALEREQQILDR